MHWGLALRNFVGPRDTPDVDALYAYAERAEALGFESVWAWDHVILGVEPAFPILDAIGVLTAIAARTYRIKLGTGVLVLPLRNPTVAAKALADRKSTRLNSSHSQISYAVFCLKKKKHNTQSHAITVVMSCTRAGRAITTPV